MNSKHNFQLSQVIKYNRIINQVNGTFLTFLLTAELLYVSLHFVQNENAFDSQNNNRNILFFKCQNTIVVLVARKTISFYTVSEIEYVCIKIY